MRVYVCVCFFFFGGGGGDGGVVLASAKGRISSTTMSNC